MKRYPCAKCRAPTRAENEHGLCAYCDNERRKAARPVCACGNLLLARNKRGVCMECIRAAVKNRDPQCSVCGEPISPRAKWGVCGAHRSETPWCRATREKAAKRRAVIAELYAGGMTATQIGAQIGITAQHAAKLLWQSGIAPLAPAVTVSALIDGAAAVTSLPRETITGTSRLRPVVRVRQAVMYLACKAGHTTPQVGKRIGGRDHSTVVHGRDMAAYRITQDPTFADMVRRIREAAPQRGVAA